MSEPGPVVASVVIPTFNRGPLLCGTVEHVLRSRLPADSEIEIVVVDDGSSLPAERALSELAVVPPFSLRVLRQANAGPAAARNAGFRAAGGRIVLFVDDDILVSPYLVARHVDAHASFPRSVVFGLTPFSAEDSPLLRYVNALNAPSDAAPFQTAERVASGHLSVERDQFVAYLGLYREDLRTPAAEEFELSYRLRTSNVPMIFAPEIVGLHLQPVDLSALCHQQYKYGVGLAEAAAKCGDLQGMPELQAILVANEPLRATDAPRVAARKVLKGILGRKRARPWVARGLRLPEKLLQGGPVLEAAYRTLLGASFYAGLQDGRKLYPRS